jgi:hypothetical protein
MWICDIAQLIKGNRARLNFNAVLQVGLEWKINPSLYLGLYMAKILFQQCFMPKTIIRGEFYIFNHWAYSHLFIKIQERILQKKNKKLLTNILSWLLIRGIMSKAKHLLLRSEQKDF